MDRNDFTRTNPEDRERFLSQPGRDRFEVTVRLIVEAESANDAYSTTTEILQEGICRAMDELDYGENEPIHEFDITDIEPAELR